MNNDLLPGGRARDTEESGTTRQRKPGFFALWTGALLRLGLGESLLRAGTHILSIVALVAVVWMLQAFYHERIQGTASAGAQAPATEAAAEPVSSTLSEEEPAPESGIVRLAQVHTNVPSRPRDEIVKYKVQKGDTIFGIAEKFGLQPQTILWGNYATLLDDPHSLQPDQVLNILPVDGTYYEWQKGDGLNGVAKYFGVKPEDIVNYPPNKLDPAVVGDFGAPNIAAGTFLIVPGGKRDFISWSAPLGITRENPSSAQVLGPGYCDPVTGGAVGFGTFVWPSNKHFLSGFDYSPKTNHWGIDIAGSEGEGVYAADAGVIVYAGWNNYGYGNMIMIDHGDGFQTLYAHLSAIYRFCGQSVGQGEGIGAFGSTGHSSGAHLHFEIRTATYFVNPWDYLPPP